MAKTEIFDDIDKTVQLREDDRLTLSSTSKGNQIKWYKNNIYYKADTFGYEGLAEVVSCILARNIKNFNFVPYYECNILEDDVMYRGCYSKTFLDKGESFFSLANLLENVYDNPEDYLCNDMKQSFQFIIDFFIQNAEIDISSYLATALYFDSIILNEDRHLNNIGLILTKNGTFRFAPYFDNGLSLLSDTKVYDMLVSVNVNIRKVKSKPFLNKFSRQVKVLNELGCVPLELNYNDFSRQLDEFTSEYYSKATVERCKNVIMLQLEKLEGSAWIRG